MFYHLNDTFQLVKCVILILQILVGYEICSFFTYAIGINVL